MTERRLKSYKSSAPSRQCVYALSVNTKTISVYLPRSLLGKLHDAMKDKGFTAESGFIVHIIRKYLEEEGYL